MVSALGRIWQENVEFQDNLGYKRRDRLKSERGTKRISKTVISYPLVLPYTLGKEILR